MVILYGYAIKKSHKCVSYYFILNEFHSYSITLCVVFGKPLKTKLICISSEYNAKTRVTINYGVTIYLSLRFEMFTENQELQAMQ